MAKEFAAGFYNSKAWRQCRLGYIRHRQSVDGGLCEACREAPGFIVHHKEPLTAWNIHNSDITLNWKNLMYVCKPCHENIHENCGRYQPNPRKIRFDAEGNPTLESSP